jgi:hypothetical protein
MLCLQLQAQIEAFCCLIPKISNVYNSHIFPQLAVKKDSKLQIILHINRIFMCQGVRNEVETQALKIFMMPVIPLSGSERQVFREVDMQLKFTLISHLQSSESFDPSVLFDV